MGTWNNLVVSKQISKLSFQLSFQIFSLLSQTEGEINVFFRRVQGGRIVRLSREHLVVIRDEKSYSVVKFEIILPLPCFLLDLLTNKHCRRWSSMINLWIDSRTCKSKESCCQQCKSLIIIT